MPKPLGYFVSVVPNHPDHPILAELESRYGSFFQVLEESDLREALLLCAISSKKPGLPPNNVGQLLVLIEKLSPQTQFSLIPFLHQLIQGD